MNKNIIIQGKECSHANCRETCHVVSNKKPRATLKRTPLKRQTTQIKRSPIKRTYKPKKKVEGIDAWFDDKIAKLTGKCLFCGGATCFDRRSVMHILPKRKNMFPSVATHEDNWIEGCFYGNSHHTNFDNNIFTLDEIKLDYPHAWSVIVDKFRRVYPAIDDAEKSKVPDILLIELNK